MNSKNRFARGLFLLVSGSAAVSVGGLQSGCATVQASDSVPASEGTVTATAGDNGNTNLSIRVRHLAPAWRVASDSTTYVVWIEPRGGTLQSIGALAPNGDLAGRLDAVTAQRSFQLTVTPEPSAEVAKPTHAPVFTSQIDRRD